MNPAFPLPPLDLTGGAAFGGAAGGPSPFNQGAWTVNLGGSGTALQAAGGGGGLSPLLMIAVIVGAAWLLGRK